MSLMQKYVLVPYDKYERLTSHAERTDQAETNKNKILFSHKSAETDGTAGREQLSARPRLSTASTSTASAVAPPPGVPENPTGFRWISLSD